MQILVALDTTKIGESAAIAMAGWSRTVPVELHLLSVVHPDEIHDKAESSVEAEFLEPETTDPDRIPFVGGGQLAEPAIVTGDPPPTTVEYRGQALARARSGREDYLRTLVARRLGGVSATLHVEFSDRTAETILETAQTLGVDAIAMGTHGRGGIMHALMGSVAEQVTRQSPVPVILIGPKAHAARTPDAQSSA